MDRFDNTETSKERREAEKEMKEKPDPFNNSVELSGTKWRKRKKKIKNTYTYRFLLNLWQSDYK